MRIELPQVGESVTEGIIGKWLKGIGDRVERFEPLVEVVTDKVNMEVPSPVTGVLTEIIAQEGETVPMGAVIADIRVEGESGPKESSGPDAAERPADGAEAIDRTGVLLKGVAPVGPTGSSGPVSAGADMPRAATRGAATRYSPAVMRLARERNVDLTRITGTGMGGRITRRDVQRAIDLGDTATAAAQPSADEERIPLSPVRRIIADNMVRSATQVPQAWSVVEVDVTGLVQLRESVRDDFQQRTGVNLTYLPFAIKAVTEALKQNRLLNSSWDGDAVIIRRRINIGVAVAAADGLVVPVIHDADAKSVTELAQQIDRLTSRAREGKLDIEDVRGGTFTVNNTGALGSVASQPLVNPPQAAILTTEAIVKRPVVTNDAIAIRSMMNICLSFDHRILDGAEASAFMLDVKGRLEAMGPGTALS